MLRTSSVPGLYPLPSLKYTGYICVDVAWREQESPPLHEISSSIDGQAPVSRSSARHPIAGRPGPCYMSMHIVRRPVTR